MIKLTHSLSFLKLLVALFITIGLLVPQRTAAAQAPSSTPLGPAAVSEFFSMLIPQQLADNNIPGAVVTVVENNQVIFSKGYGFANVEKQVPVDPQQTLFRIGSVSKLFTWTAVMQLAEQGKLDLDEDINQYLDFQVPATFPQPITMKHLMSHTAGFEDNSFETAVHTPADIEPMVDWLINHQPARVRAPGRFLAYSNYGTQLAAYIVQRVSGLGYDDYIEQKILQPLGMNRTSPRQPNPEPLAADLAIGYTYLNGSYQTVPFDYDACAGAANINSTAADMARFIQAHLQDSSPILKPETARQMHSALLTYHTRMSSFLYGFYEMNQNGLRIYGHSGDHPGFHSILALIPEEKLGIFVAYNGDVPSVLQERTLAAFVDHFFPTKASTPQVTPSLQNGSRVAGYYRPLRSAYTSPEKSVYLISSYVFSAEPDGSLVLQAGLEQVKYVEVEPLVFQQVDGDDLFRFMEDEKGNIAYAAHNLPTMSMYERYPWYEYPPMHLLVIGINLLVLVSCLVAAGIRGVIRILFRRKARQAGKLSAWWADAVLLLASGFVLLFLVMFITAVADPQAIATGEATFARVALACSTLVAVAAPVVTIATVWVWKRGVWKPLRRLHYTLGSMALIALTFSFWVWNLIGWQF